MTLRLFADHCISNAIVHALEDHHHEVMRLRDFIPRDSPDAVVIAQAQSQNTILLSLNGDFADIVTYPPAKYQGIIALEVHNHPEAIPAIMEQLSLGGSGDTLPARKGGTLNDERWKRGIAVARSIAARVSSE